jgi:RimJ/RimL family protein N-acetyltransferase
MWGRGLASEAAEGVVAWAFRPPLDAASLFAGHHPHNGASRRVLEKLGFRMVGAEVYEPTGLEHPSYVLLRPR